MSKLNADDIAALKKIGIHGDDLECECSPVVACNYKLLFVAKYGCEGLMWLVNQDRITLDKAYRTALKADGWDQIDLLQCEYLETGTVEGMTNRNDVFIIPDELEMTSWDKITKE